MGLKTLDKRIKTNQDGIFYKEIINDSKKVVDKIFLIRYRENDKDKLITIGKYSQGIRIEYCKEKRFEILNNIRLGEMPTTIKAKRIKKNCIKFDEIANDYFEYISIHTKDFSNTKSRYQLHIEEFLGNKDISRISASEIEKIQKLKLKKLAPKTVNHLIQLIGTIYNFAINRNKYRGNNPTQNVKRLKINNARERFLSKDEITKLIDVLQGDMQLVLFVKIALSTGARFETINQIKKKDINLDERIITLKDFKNNTNYKGFIQEDLVQLLEERLSTILINDYVVNFHETKDLRSKLTKKFKPILDNLFNQGLAKDDYKNRVVVHTLRHTFASHLAINGTPIFTIQKLLNHKDITMTMRYAKLSPDSGKEFINNLYK